MKKILIMILVLATIFLVSCSTKESDKSVESEAETKTEELSTDTVVKITIDGEELSEEYFKKQLALNIYNTNVQLGEDYLKEKKNVEKLISDTTNALIQFKVYEIMANEAGFKIDKDAAMLSYNQFIASVDEKMKNYLDENEIGEEYLLSLFETQIMINEYLNSELEKIFETDEFKEKYKDIELAKASHILIPANQEEKANEIYEKINENPELFESIAEQESTDTASGSMGGNLGYFSKGTMVKEFSDAVFNAEIGELLKPVRSEFGWHIIRVDDKGLMGEIESKLENGVELEKEKNKIAYDIYYKKIEEMYQSKKETLKIETAIIGE